MERIQTVYDAGRTRRVVIYARRSGTFGFIEERWSDDPLEQAWLPRKHPQCFCDSAEHALREAEQRIDWLSTASLPTPENAYKSPEAEGAEPPRAFKAWHVTAIVLTLAAVALPFLFHYFEKDLFVAGIIIGLGTIPALVAAYLFYFLFDRSSTTSGFWNFHVLLASFVWCIAAALAWLFYPNSNAISPGTWNMDNEVFIFFWLIFGYPSIPTIIVVLFSDWDARRAAKLRR